jgi:8-oxo-dGTP diphosphatase
MRFKIGIGVVIKKGDKVLIGQRIGSHGADTWSFPGGHLEEDETPEVTGQREVLEETGLIVSNLTPAGFTFDHFEEIDTDYLTLFYSCDWTAGTPEVREKEKCREWRWEAIEHLPEPLFKPIASFIKQLPSL